MLRQGDGSNIHRRSFHSCCDGAGITDILGDIMPAIHAAENQIGFLF